MAGLSMRLWWAAGAIVFVGFGLGILATTAARRWQRETRRVTEALTASGRATSVDARRRLAGREAAAPDLPAPVARYFARVLPGDSRLVYRAQVTWEGTFRQVVPPPADDEAGWMRFGAEQVFVTTPPGFVWDARMGSAPFLAVYVRDGYVAGRGLMRAAALGLVTLVDEQDRPELNQGALLRYLCEAVWFPTALLPGASLEWTAVDDSRARAILRDRHTSVAAVFEFAPSGEIVAVAAERHLASAGGYELTPWRGRYGRYETYEGFHVPSEAEVSWVLDGRARPYWRGEVTSVSYEFASGNGGEWR